MTITSTAIDGKGKVMPQYTCDGKDINPPLTFSEIPVESQSLALVMDDPDAPGGIFTHWLLYDMSPATLQITENHMPLTGKAGTNSFGKVGYGGPCPPSGTHRYFFTLYALNTVLDLPEGATKEALVQAMDGHVLAQCELVGTYTKVG
jgi:Raf kinase inhibitor-like YbhB/YbcL family protein